jgi:hypothetical protein
MRMVAVRGLAQQGMEQARMTARARGHLMVRRTWLTKAIAHLVRKARFEVPEDSFLSCYYY